MESRGRVEVAVIEQLQFRLDSPFISAVVAPRRLASRRLIPTAKRKRRTPLNAPPSVF
jgi:hypothetical protein